MFVALDCELVRARLARGSFSRTTNQPWDKKMLRVWRVEGEGEGELIETLAHTHKHVSMHISLSVCVCALVTASLLLRPCLIVCIVVGIPTNRALNEKDNMIASLNLKDIHERSTTSRGSCRLIGPNMCKLWSRHRKH